MNIKAKNKSTILSETWLDSLEVMILPESSSLAYLLVLYAKFNR